MAPRLSVAAQDKKWMRESDARTLAEAERIRSTPARIKGAVKEAKVMAKEDEKRAMAMRKVAKAPARKAPARKAPARKAPAKSFSNKVTPRTLTKRK